MIEKTETKSEHSSENKGETQKGGDGKEKVHELDTARGEGLRRNPLYQTGNLDTSDTAGGPVDLRNVSPLFEESRQDAIRKASESVKNDEYDPNLVMPTDEADTEVAKADLHRQAAELPNRDKSDERESTHSSKPEIKQAGTTKNTAKTYK